MSAARPRRAHAMMERRRERASLLRLPHSVSPSHSGSWSWCCCRRSDILLHCCSTVRRGSARGVGGGVWGGDGSGAGLTRGLTRRGRPIRERAPGSPHQSAQRGKVRSACGHEQQGRLSLREDFSKLLPSVLQPKITLCLLTRWKSLLTQPSVFSHVL